MYPQIDNNILLFPQFANYNLASLWTAFSVNWTPVHAISWTYEIPNDLRYNIPPVYQYSWNWYWWLPPICCISNVAQTTWWLFRVWLETQIQAWLILWKQIVFPILYAYWWSYNIGFKLKVKVWLLHTDWTISYIAENDYWSSISNTAEINTTNNRAYSMYSNWWQFWKSNTVISTNWLETQEWDRIVVEYQFYWWNNATNYFIIWCHTPTKKEEMVYPIQISID